MAALFWAMISAMAFISVGEICISHRQSHRMAPGWQSGRQYRQFRRGSPGAVASDADDGALGDVASGDQATISQSVFDGSDWQTKCGEMKST